MKIAITGVTGQLGRLTVDKLSGRIAANEIVGLARSPQKAANLGIDVRKADYDKLETVAQALNGIDTLLLISGSEVGKRATQHKNVIEAAQHAGVSWIIYTSLLHADTSTLNLAAEHLTTEHLLKNSGIPFTILRNGWYTENYTRSIRGALAGGSLLGCAGNGKIAWASRADFADAAVAVLTTYKHHGKTYELAGDKAYTLSDLASEISRQTGKEIFFKNLLESEYIKTLQTFGVPESLAKAIASWDISAAKGDLFDDSHQLSKLIKRPTTPLADVVAYTLKNR